jgi:hypothetical protein
MSIFVDAAKLIGNLVGLGHNFVGPNGPQVNFGSGEYLAANVTSMSADAVGAGLSALPLANNFSGIVNNSLKLRTFAEHFQGDPILWALNIVEVLEWTTGFGPPHEGDDLKAGSEQFAKVFEQLGSAFSDDSWQGAASEAYTKQNKDLQDLAKRMREQDAKLAAKVKDHAEWVTHARSGFAALKGLLITAVIIELIIYATVPAPAGLTAGQTFARTVAVLGVGIAGSMVAILSSMSGHCANEVNFAAVEYGEVAASAQKLAIRLLAAKARVPAAEQSTVSSFEDISAGMPKMSAPPEAPALASVASGGSSAVAGTPETTSTPGFTMPTLAQLTAMSGQAAKLSGHVTPHATLVNQAMGQIQQIAQMAQQGQEATAPAKERAPKEPASAEAALAEAAPAEGAERAPIEAAPVSPEQAHEPIPAQRTM